MKNAHKSLVSAAVLSGFMMVCAQASAQSVSVTCKSGGGRSSAEVEAFDLAPGWYSAVLASAKGVNQSQSGREYAERDDDDDANDDDVDFEFDSKPSEVRDGDTEIAPDFIVGNRVTAVLLDASGAEVARASQTCKRR